MRVSSTNTVAALSSGGCDSASKVGYHDWNPIEAIVRLLVCMEEYVMYRHLDDNENVGLLQQAR
jgi:hypothetical protein